MIRPTNTTVFVLLTLLTQAVACLGGSVGAHRISGRDADRQLAANVLATGDPSAWSLQTLHRHDLLGLYAEDRGEALSQLHASLLEPNLEPERWRNRLFALTELSFHHARHEDERSWFLASAVYAYGFLMGVRDHPPEEIALDSRTRLAADLYNRALTEGLEYEGQLQVADGQHALPFGNLSLDLDESDLRWGSFILRDFVPTAELEIYGISNRYRHPGVGAPLAAGLEPAPDATGEDASRIGPRSRVASTLVMRIGDLSREALMSGGLKGTLALYTADVRRELEIQDGRRVPLEVDTTAALALQLEDFDTFTSISGSFLSGDLGAAAADSIKDQLAMISPYRPARVPVVFVHGTYSDPSTWVEMLNELSNDPVLSDRLQFWFFFYASGNPIGYSGGLLAEALRGIVQDLDPAGKDPALQHMVVIGHSQGGLLTKLSVVDSQLKFWETVFEGPPEELAVSDATKQTLTRSLIFKPVEAVKRVIFISTPHGGSFLTRNRLASAVGSLISIPSALTDRIADVLRQDPDAVALKNLDDIPTSLDNMRAGNPFLETLHAMPVAEGIDVHSIVAVQGDGPPDELSDGVVRYVSAHITQGTEQLVNSGHSSHRDPVAIAEVRRILREHLAAFPGPELQH